MVKKLIKPEQPTVAEAPNGDATNTKIDKLISHLMPTLEELDELATPPTPEWLADSGWADMDE